MELVSHMNVTRTACPPTPARQLIRVALLAACAANLALAARPHGRIGIVGKTTIDLGTFPAHEKRTAEFKLINIGDAPLDVTKVRHSCGCATTSVTPSRLAPQTTTVIKVTTIPGSLEGSFEKIAYVESTDPYQPVIQLKFKGIARPLVSITPSPYVYASRIATNAAWSKTFTLTRNRPDVRLALPVTTGNYEAEARLSPWGDDGKVRILSIDLAPSSVPGRLKIQVDIPILQPTNHPPLRVVVAAKVGDEAFAIPHRLTLPTDEERVTRRFRLRLVALRAGRGQPQDVEWPTLDGVRFTPDGSFVQDQLHFTAVFDRPFLVRLKREKEIVLHIPVAGATPARIQCRAE